MSELRQVALSAAIQIAPSQPADTVLGIATQVLAFLEGKTEKVVDAPAKVKVAAKPTAPKAAAKPTAPKAEQPKTEEPATAGVTKEQASEALNELLKANKKAQAIELLKKFGAKNISTLAAEKYAEFVEAAEGILLT